MRRFLSGAILLLAACVSSGPSDRSLHELDGELVHSRPVSPVAYEAYLQARMALEQDPPDLARARDQIDLALRYDPREPHLWTVRAEIERQGGEAEAAMASLRRALELRPGYPPATKLLASLSGSETASR